MASVSHPLPRTAGAADSHGHEADDTERSRRAANEAVRIEGRSPSAREPLTTLADAEPSTLEVEHHDTIPAPPPFDDDSSPLNKTP